MNRRVLAGMLGLTVAGCAQGRATQSPAGQTMPPVGMQPLPSIHQTISADVRQLHPENRVAMRDADLAEPDPIAALESAGEQDSGPRNGPVKQREREESAGKTQVADNELPFFRRPRWRRMPDRLEPDQAVQDRSGQPPIETASRETPRAEARRSATPTVARKAAAIASARPSNSALLDSLPSPVSDDSSSGSRPDVVGIDVTAPQRLNQAANLDQAATPATSVVGPAETSTDDLPPPIPDMPPVLPALVDSDEAAITPAQAELAPTSTARPEQSRPSEPAPVSGLARNAAASERVEPLGDLTPLPGEVSAPGTIPAVPGGASPSAPPAATPSRAQGVPVDDLPPLPGELSRALAPEDESAGELLPPIELPPLPGEIPALPDSNIAPLPDSAAPAGPALELNLPPLPGESTPAGSAPAGPSQPQPHASSAGGFEPPCALDLAVEIPEPAPGTAGGSRKTAPRVPAPEPPALSDTAVQTVAADPTALRAQLSSKAPEQAGLIAARVGNDVITLQELQKAVEGRRKGVRLSNEELNLLASRALDDLIDQTLIIQETRRTIKDKKKFEMFKEFVNKAYLDEELPPLLRKHNVNNEYELRQKLAKDGLSLDAMREEFGKMRMAREFMEMNLRPRMTVDLPEMRDFYNAHLKEFDRPAQITWREVAVELSRHADRAEARRKADALLDRLRRGENFASLAKAESESPSPDEGGLWKTSPGASVVPAVNDALARLPLQQISSVLEGPTSFHIVRVEARREAGSARFDEVQSDIRLKLLEMKYQREARAFIIKLRGGTLISTVFDGSESAPTVTSTTPVSSAETPPSPRRGPQPGG